MSDLTDREQTNVRTALRFLRAAARSRPPAAGQGQGDERMTTEKVRFVSIVTGTMTTANTGLPLQWGGSWTVVYALADDGTVWWWGGTSWVMCGPQPERAKP